MTLLAKTAALESWALSVLYTFPRAVTNAENAELTSVAAAAAL